MEVLVLRVLEEIQDQPEIQVQLVIREMLVQLDLKVTDNFLSLMHKNSFYSKRSCW